MAFCRKRKISIEGIRISQSVDWHRKRKGDTRVGFLVEIPASFPPKYRKAIAAIARACLVYKLARGITGDTVSCEITVAGEDPGAERT